MERDFITIVSGLPRSGTSLMMQMLAAGGVPALTDAVRAPDENNPRGYLEFEKVKRLRVDQSWLEQARGHAVKIIHLLLRELPTDGRFHYRVILMKRPIEEVLASQATMLLREGKQSGDVAILRKVYLGQLAEIEQWLATTECFALRALHYHEVVSDPIGSANEISEFLEAGLDVDAMSRSVDPSLWRQRSQPV